MDTNKQKKPSSRLKHRMMLGFTLLEVMTVVTIMGKIPQGSFTVVKQKGVETQCKLNMQQMGQALTMYMLENDAFPDASFFSSDPSGDPKSINNVLSTIPKKMWICPSSPPELAKHGLTYIYNDNLAGKRAVANPSKTWVLIEVNAVSKVSPMPHPGGYNILFADGHVATSRSLPPDVAKARR